MNLPFVSYDSHFFREKYTSLKLQYEEALGDLERTYEDLRLLQQEKELVEAKLQAEKKRLFDAEELLREVSLKCQVWAYCFRLD